MVKLKLFQPESTTSNKINLYTKYILSHKQSSTIILINNEQTLLSPAQKKKNILINDQLTKNNSWFILLNYPGSFKYIELYIRSKKQPNKDLIMGEQLNIQN